MKKVYLLVFVLLVSVTSFGQKFEVGVNGGIGYNSLVNVSSDNTSPLKGATSNINCPDFSLKTVRNSKKWQYGCSIDLIKDSYKEVDTRFIGSLNYLYNPALTPALQTQAIQQMEARLYGTKPILHRVFLLRCL